MSPSPACAPRRRGAPRRLRSRKAPIRENGGTFLPTTRPDDLDSPTGASACLEPPSDKGAPSDRTPAFLDRPPGRGAPVRGRAAPRGSRHDRRRSARQGPQAHRKAGLDENGLASHLDHPGHPRRSAADPAIDAGQPALGRAATARGLATPDATPLGGAASGRGPTLSRTDGILTRIRHHNNRPAAPASQIPVHGFPNDAQFIGRLSTE